MKFLKHSSNSSYHSLKLDLSVLILAEIILFLVADTVLCFGSHMRIILITHWCFSWCQTVQSRTFQCPLLCRDQVPKRLGEHGQESWSHLVKGIFQTQTDTGRVWTGGSCLGGARAAGGQAEHWAAGAEQPHHCISLASQGFIPLSFPFITIIIVISIISTLTIWFFCFNY